MPRLSMMCRIEPRIIDRHQMTSLSGGRPLRLAAGAGRATSACSRSKVSAIWPSQSATGPRSSVKCRYKTARYMAARMQTLRDLKSAASKLRNDCDSRSEWAALSADGLRNTATIVNE
jgi:hypothetical protein